MKLASLGFFALLVYAHQVSGLETSLDQPLSLFREGELGLLGYALFCAIVLVGVLYIFGIARAGQHAEAANGVISIMLLLVVAATPSTGDFHCLCALALLASMYGYYAVLIFRSASAWLLIHLSVPVVLLVATGFQSYGIWQKGLIVYFVFAAMVHHHLATRHARAPAAVEADMFYKRRKMYRVEPGPASARRHLK